MKRTQPIHAFIAGTHQTALGESVTISVADLQAAASAYNPELHEAPLVIGHPDGKAPAYGWIESCAVDGDNLFVTAKQVSPDFAELHNSGAFKKRSMSFYHPDNAINPVPGVWYPRHLGFLGAQPPAIKGLRAHDFSEDEGDTLTVDFGEFEDRIEAGMWRNLREWILAKFGSEDADAAVSKWDVDTMQAEALKEKTQDNAPLSSAFSEHLSEHQQPKEGAMTPEDIMTKKAKLANKQAKMDTREQALNARDAEFAEREQRLQKGEQAAHRATCVDFVESLINDGKVMPAQKENLVRFMAGLEQVETVAFAEGDSTVDKSSLQFMQDFLQSQPQVVTFGEHQPSIAASAGAVTIAVPAGYEVNREKAEIHAKAITFSEANHVDYITAVKAVSQ